MSNTESTTSSLPALDITCTSADCPNGLHSFRPTRKMRNTLLDGACRECNQHLISWERVHRRDLEDVEFTFESLKVELIRHHYWHVPFPQRALDYATRKGRLGLEERVPLQIAKAVGTEKQFRDGTQTPRENSAKVNPIHIAQHATASCCRKCVEEWHGVPRDRDLEENEIDYLSALAIRFLRERLPDLEDVGRRVPRAA